MKARKLVLQCLFTCCIIGMLLPLPAAANINGAIYTTLPNGQTVNGNIYHLKTDVYLDGGPQNMHGQGLPDGDYYFQVTDPSGAVLLSQDDISCRVLQVSGGVVIGHPIDSFGNPGCYHLNGANNPANGSTPIQLCGATGCPTGVPPSCTPGSESYCDTPNHGGEYKVWITPATNYDPVNCASNYGFCNDESKTDNFKVRVPGVAYVTACKFIDVDGDGTFDNQDYLTAGWPITATGVDGDTGSGVTQNTDQDGCTTFTVSGLHGMSQATVTLTEGSMTGFTQTAPPTGACQFVTGSDDPDGDASCMVTGGASPPWVITVMVDNADAVIAPFFGNQPPGGNTPPPLLLSKTAAGGNNFNWTIQKSATHTEIDNTGNATFTYNVVVTHDAGTGWVVAGQISINNPGTAEADGVQITDTIDNGGTCTVEGGGGTNSATITVPSMNTVTLNYSCTFTTNPGSGTNTVSLNWPGGPQVDSTTAAYDFTAADTSVTVTDTLGGNLGTATINTDNSTSCTAASVGFNGDPGSLTCGVNGAATTFTYTITFTGDHAGTCTLHDNTATFTTNTNVTGTSSAEVKHCVGKDLTVSKTATATFNSSISKSVDRTKVEQSGGTVTFHYTVTVTESGWQVAGSITVMNPNDWEDIIANVTDSIDSGGNCVVTGGSSVTIAKSNQVTLPYTCTYSTRPTLVTGTNTATAMVVTGIVPDNSVNGTAPYTFNTLTITDNVQSSMYPSGCNATLGTVSVTTTTPNGSPGCGVTNLASPQWGVFTYTITDNNAPPAACVSYNNTAQIMGGGSSNQVTVTVCNTRTGALTMGFWKGPNGQGIITNYCGGQGTTLDAFLTGYNPFKDLSATATCRQIATYVSNVIGAATCGGSTCNPMLRAQMLATALDVYFSTPGLGGNKIGGYTGLGGSQPALGGVAIDLSHICSMIDSGGGGSCSGMYEDARYEFGIVTTPPCLGTTISNMLAYANANSTGGNGTPVASPNTGAVWYNQNKNPKQVYAKDSFDNFNNQIAGIAPAGNVCSPTF